MRRLVILFALIAAIGTVEHFTLMRTAARNSQASRRVRRVRRVLTRLANWRAFLGGAVRLGLSN
jgi:hypothetical protein